MKEWIRKNIVLIVTIFLVCQPLIDSLTAISINIWHLDITFGLIIRLGFLAFLLIYNFIIEKPKKKNFMYLLLVILYFILFTTNVILTKDTSVLFYELKNMARLFYFPLLLINLYDIKKKTDKTISTKTLITTYMIYIALILIPMITNTDFSGYFEGKVGTIGWFYSSNEIGAILSGLLPYLFFYPNKLTKLILLLIPTIIVFFSLGSKITIFTLGLVSLFYIITKFLKSPNKKKTIPITLLIIALGGVSIILLLPKTSFYKNIKIHLDFLGVENITDVFKSKELLDHFIFSSRLSFLEETNKNYQDASLTTKLIGLGFIENYARDDVNIKTIEMDIFDIFYRSGIIGTIIILMPIGLIIIDKKREKVKIFETKEQALSLSIFTLIALLSGHVLTSPAVSFYLVIIGLNWIKEDTL